MSYTSTPSDKTTAKPDSAPLKPEKAPDKIEEVGGRKGLDPTRYNDWEIGGKCVDF